MALKPNAQTWNIREQIVEDPASGLTLKFERRPDGLMALKIFGDLPYGNRDLLFKEDGGLAAAGTAVAGCTKPSWIRPVS